MENRYEVIKETASALLLKYYYYHIAGPTKKKNVQKSFDFWIPKVHANTLDSIHNWFLKKVSEYNANCDFFKKINKTDIQPGIAPEREKYHDDDICPVKEEKRSDAREEFARIYFPGVAWWMIDERDAREEDLYDEWKSLVDFPILKKITKYRDI